MKEGELSFIHRKETANLLMAVSSVTQQVKIIQLKENFLSNHYKVNIFPSITIIHSELH